jgi:hypothetical protein
MPFDLALLGEILDLLGAGSVNTTEAFFARFE